MTTNRQKLQNLLHELFQFDYADLDFGIYRIMKAKQADVENFIEEDLLNAVDESLSKFQTAEREDVERKIAKLRRDLKGGFDEKGDLIDDLKNIKVGQDYLELDRQLKNLNLADETEAHIFDDLYRFFSRYYDNGDFLSQRRYSSQDHKFAVPYNGEEVLLHWANRDQYYVKTGERFTHYRFTAGHYTIWFKLAHADVPKDNVKSNHRYFILRGGEDGCRYEENDHILTLVFEYRPLSDDEEKYYLEIYNAQQSKSDRRKTLDRSVLVIALEHEIIDRLDAPELKAHLARVPEGKNHSVLRKHLNKYTARNTMDYFVHKDLAGFLHRELDYFIKTEVLYLDDWIEHETEIMFLHAMTRAKVVRAVARHIIQFLAQIENFQKRLFEKKKFVVQTDYCLTLDQVPGELYAEILANRAQLDEWQQLYRLDEWDETLFWQGQIDRAFMDAHPYLMIDTAFYDDDFKARLLATFDDLDASIDGLLIHGENFQALNLMQEKYRERVKCIYIDPPYNTGNDDFVYKDSYQHSSWLTMMADRLSLAKRVLHESGVFFANISDEEQARLKILLDKLFGSDAFLADVIWHARKSVSSDAIFSLSHHHTFAYCADQLGFETVKDTFCLPADKDGFENHDNDPRGLWKADPFDAPNIRPNLTYQIENPATGEKFWPPEGRCWRTTPEKYKHLLADNRIIFGKTGTAKPQLKRFWSEAKERGRTPTTIWADIDTTTRGTQQVQNLFDYKAFNNPKPVNLLIKILKLGNSQDIALDYFAGSGTTAHAVMNLNREDGGERKYILVEMGDYFDTVLKPRLQKVAFSANWKDGGPQDSEGMSQFFKYQRIESYEDSLNNIRIQEPQGEQRRLLYEEFDDYMLGYMLDFETRASKSLLTQEAFEKPFDYKLKIQRGYASPQPEIVDLVETFHYLIGMQVESIRHYEHQERDYTLTQGTVHSNGGIQRVLTLWRKTEGLDYAQEEKWASEQLPTNKVDIIYVNNGTLCRIPGAEPLDFIFRDLMAAGGQ
ncbi:MAG: site-specific DNA-methyltransferase [Chloroflexota bacterium]|nr:site-specific DNA-methyltransferase [Chloroflexota bacterium]